MRLAEMLYAAEQVQPGVRLAMVIDLPKCREVENCDLCIQACHRAHNVPTISDPAEEVMWIWKDDFDRAFYELTYPELPESIRTGPVLLMCNHCENPPCVTVCPTKATWKRASDGIVMMDWHRCIGCRYCIAACPYGSRSFNWRDPQRALQTINSNFPTRVRGVVEKCTFCEERLADGLRPLCVEACPAKALHFGDLSEPNSEVAALLKGRFSIRRKPALGTGPQVYYLI